MARVKVKGAGGKPKSVESSQAAQLGLSTLDDGVPVRTGNLDVAPGPMRDDSVDAKEPRQSAGIGPYVPRQPAGFGVDPARQRSMFPAPRANGSVFNMNQDRWKKAQRKAGLMEF